MYLYLTCSLLIQVYLTLQGSTREEIESLAYTSKKINTVAGLHTYVSIGICSPRDLHVVEAIWNALFKNVDLLFYASTKANKSGAHPCA